MGVMATSASLPRRLRHLESALVVKSPVQITLSSTAGFVQHLRTGMEIKNLHAAPSFVTKDGSEIRELLAYRNSGIRNQTRAEARLHVGAATQEHYHSKSEEIYFITAGRGRMRLEG